MFKIVKKYYDRGYYLKEDVAKFVKADKITVDEYEQITGEVYKED